MKKAPPAAEASPYKSVAEELETLRRSFRAACQQYTERIEAEISGLRDRVISTGEEPANARALAATTARPLKPGAATRNKQAYALARIHDLRDMLTLLRTLAIKPAEGRRKDLKKVETVVEELRMLAAGWA